MNGLWWPAASLYAFGNDVEVKLSHSGDNNLVGFLVGTHTEGWIFFSKLLKSHTHLFLVRF